METAVDYPTIEQPPAPLAEGEQLLRTALGEKYVSTLLAAGIELTDLTIADYGPKGGGPRSVIEGKLSNNNSFVLDCDLQGDNRTGNQLFVQYPGGGAKIHNMKDGTETSRLADATNPDAGKKLKTDFVTSLDLGKPSIKRDYLPPAPKAS